MKDLWWWWWCNFQERVQYGGLSQSRPLISSIIIIIILHNDIHDAIKRGSIHEPRTIMMMVRIYANDDWVVCERETMGTCWGVLGRAVDHHSVIGSSFFRARTFHVSSSWFNCKEREGLIARLTPYHFNGRWWWSCETRRSQWRGVTSCNTVYYNAISRGGKDDGQLIIWEPIDPQQLNPLYFVYLSRDQYSSCFAKVL